MATKSILKNITITDKKLVHTFVKSLSNIEDAKYTPKKLTRECKVIKGDAVKDFFDK